MCKKRKKGKYKKVKKLEVLSSSDRNSDLFPSYLYVDWFSGLWFAQNGKVKFWNFHSDPVDRSTLVILMVYRPACPTGNTLFLPGTYLYLKLSYLYLLYFYLYIVLNNL